MESSSAKLLAVTGYPPSTTVGGGIILRNLLCQYDKASLIVCSNGSLIQELEARPDRGGLLEVPHIGVRPWRPRLRGLRRLVRSLQSLRFPGIGLQLSRLTHNYTAILAVPWGGELGSELFVSAYFAHLLSGAPLIIYEMDEWRASLSGKAGRMARLYEKLFHGRMIRAASCVWAISSQMAEELHTRFGIQARVLSSSVELERYSNGGSRRYNDEGVFRILYTGAIYGAQADAIRNVLSALQSIQYPSISLVVYSQQSSNELARVGLTGKGLVVNKPVPVEQIPDILLSADALLLPFSFEHEQRNVVSTSLPTKLGDYLASGVPVLVHAPPYTTVARLARSEGWGLVVDDQCVESLTRALNQLASNQSLRQQLRARALEVAQERHNSRKSRAEFIASIEAAANAVYT
jgi:glycosyltransferase involved in cell wall biosynthesis